MANDQHRAFSGWPGLHHKYDVRKGSTGEVVHDCFVLTPVSDPHARWALSQYALSCRNEHPELAGDLYAWIAAIEEATR